MAHTIHTAPDVAVGIDIGGTAIKWVALSADGSQPVGGEIPTPREGPDAVFAAVAELCRSVDGSAIGLAVPGPVELDGTFDFVPNLGGDWQNVPFVAQLEARTGIPVVSMNDAHAHARAEIFSDPANLVDGAIIALGTGVGGALVLEGKVYRGSSGRAGELGHIVVDAEGPLCPCGNQGCLEAFASVRSMTTAFHQRVGLTPGESSPSLAEIVESAEAGNVVAQAVLTEAGRALGIAITATAATVVADLIVIGGGGAIALERMLPATNEVLERRRPLMPPPLIRRSDLGRHAGALGAAIWAAESHGTPLDNMNVKGIS